MLNLYIAVAMFTGAALLGIFIYSRWFKKNDAPKMVIWAHGIFAITGLIFLFAQMLNQPDNYPQISAIFFPLAAVGGLYLLYRNQVKKLHPVGVATAHMLLAVVGYATLLIYVFG